jgi:hypothetical protein
MEFRFSICSQLKARPEAVWNSVSTMRGVNAELWPMVRMTVPEGMEDVSISAMPLGQPAFKSRILILGFIPFDVHELTLLRVKPEREFYEHSRSLVMRDWIHERTIQPKMTGCEIVDQIRFTPKIAALGYLLFIPFRIVFWT